MTKHDDTAGTVPGWAATFVPEEWAWFMATVATDLDARNVKHAIDVDSGTVETETPGTGAPHLLGLANLVQVCRANGRDHWPALVKHHFDIAFEAAHTNAAERLARDWSLAREHVKLRLYVRDNLPDVPLVTWEVADELLAVLTFDLPETVISVRLEDRERWGVSDDELYEVALANVRAEGLLETRTIDLEDDTSLHVLEGGATFFAASHALFLDEYLKGAQGPHGAILALPQRHAVIYHPIHDLRVVRAIEAMIVTATNMYVDGPGSISSDLYWLPPRADDSSLEDLSHSLVRLPCEIHGGTLRFLPPVSFARMLGKLPPGPLVPGG
ncbi:MAG: hypothetical protein JWP97_3945 [Labilithrix sp.]|nr:hypothetical protein [Labilithrix sp.]